METIQGGGQVSHWSVVLNDGTSERNQQMPGMAELNSCSTN
jgi:hypothetical protein